MKSNRHKQAELTFFFVVAASYFFALTYKAFEYYFDMHDIHNLSWAHIKSPLYFLIDTLNPLTNATIHTYRPAGALFYNLCYQLSGIDYPEFHFTATAIHLLNTTIVFILIRDFVKHTFAAFVGGMLFAFHAAAIPAYWRFSSIFDLLCASLMFLSFLFYIKTTTIRSFSFFVSLVLFFFACRTKEMAFAQPVILLFYELCVDQRPASRTPSRASTFNRVMPFLVIAIFLGLPKVFAWFLVEKGHAYALDMDSLSKNVLFYWNNLFQAPQQSHLGWIAALLSGLIALITRNKLLQFGYCYFYIALAPVLLLASHRQNFFLYIPLFGVCLYAAELYRSIAALFSEKKKVRKEYLYCFVFVLFSAYTLHNVKIKATFEDQYLKEGIQVKRMIHVMKPLHPRKNSLILFDSTPDFFDVVVLDSAVHLVYHDWTILTQMVQDCEKVKAQTKRPEVYCISYRREKVYRIPVQGKL